MRLLTHNQLVCVRKGCNNHYPLILAATKMERQATSSANASAADSSSSGKMQQDEDESEEELEEEEPNLDFVLHVLPNLDYAVLRDTANKLGVGEGLPETLPDVATLNKEKDAALLTKLHQVLVETIVLDGTLTCDNCGRSYPIQQGIPNMRLNEDEV